MSRLPLRRLVKEVRPFALFSDTAGRSAGVFPSIIHGTGLPCDQGRWQMATTTTEKTLPRIPADVRFREIIASADCVIAQEQAGGSTRPSLDRLIAVLSDLDSERHRARARTSPEIPRSSGRQRLLDQIEQGVKPACELLTEPGRRFATELRQTALAQARLLALLVDGRLLEPQRLIRRRARRRRGVEEVWGAHTGVYVVRHQMMATPGGGRRWGADLYSADEHGIPVHLLGGGPVMSSDREARVDDESIRIAIEQAVLRPPDSRRVVAK
jgi:hypothetical protein